jgi:AcrR family transcriptional regulator
MNQTKRDQRKNKIKVIASELFLSQGYKKTTIRGIAEKGDLALGTLYNYYSSKEHIFLEILQEQVSQGLASFEKKNLGDSVNPSFVSHFSKLFMHFSKIYTHFPKELWREALAASYSLDLAKSNALWDTQEQLFALILLNLELMIQTETIKAQNSIELVGQQLFSLFIVRFLQYINTEMPKEAFLHGIDQQLANLYEGIRNE